jgi:hypothetical protein
MSTIAFVPTSDLRKRTSSTFVINNDSTRTAGDVVFVITVKFSSISLSPSVSSSFILFPNGFRISSAASYKQLASLSELFYPLVVHADQPVAFFQTTPFPAALTWIESIIAVFPSFLTEVYLLLIL